MWYSPLMTRRTATSKYFTVDYLQAVNNKIIIKYKCKTVSPTTAHRTQR